MFGPKACLFVADNNWGPSIDIVKHWKTLNARQLDFSVPKENMKIVAEIYKSFKELNSEKRPIPFIFEEDETSIEPRPEYDEKTNKVYGYCGVKGDEHRCEDFYAIEVIVLQISTIR